MPHWCKLSCFWTDWTTFGSLFFGAIQNIETCSLHRKNLCIIIVKRIDVFFYVWKWSLNAIRSRVPSFWLFALKFRLLTTGPKTASKCRSGLHSCTIAFPQVSMSRGSTRRVWPGRRRKNPQLSPDGSRHTMGKPKNSPLFSAWWYPPYCLCSVWWSF